MKAATKTALIEFLTDRGPKEIDFQYYLEDKDFENFDEVRDAIHDENGFEVEITYYSNAIAYLKEHDPSLQESLSMADDLGYKLTNINSETLASLLATELTMKQFDELESEFTSLLEELESIEENV
jgi:hypothetical protein